MTLNSSISEALETPQLTAFSPAFTTTQKIKNSKIKTLNTNKEHKERVFHSIYKQEVVSSLPHRGKNNDGTLFRKRQNQIRHLPHPLRRRHRRSSELHHARETPLLFFYYLIHRVCLLLLFKRSSYSSSAAFEVWTRNHPCAGSNPFQRCEIDAIWRKV